MVELPWSNSVSNRFTPPTCSLEVSARRSVLSQWSDRPVWKHVRFQLRFDDPRLSDDQHVVVRGDRRQLEALVQVVSDYVNQQLGVDLTMPSLANWLAADAPAASFSSARRSGSTAAPPPPSPTPARFGLAIRPQGALHHELVLGELMGDRPTVQLSTTQLFDLATALDEYEAAGLVLPALPARQSRPVAVQRWGAIAASVLLTVAVAPTVYRRVFAPNADMAEITAESDSANADLQIGQSEPRLDTSSQIDRGALSSDAIPPAPETLDTFPLAEPPPPAPDANATAAAPSEPGVAANPAVPDPAASAPATSAAPSAPSAPDPLVLPPPSAGTARSPESSRTASEGFAADTQPSLETRSSAPARQATAPPSPTLFDSSPQIAEARSYLQQRWSPPEELSQKLEYRVTVGGDGVVQQIVPLGDDSATYQAAASLPALGEGFVSPLEGADSLRIRVVLSPNGRVRTFAE